MASTSPVRWRWTTEPLSERMIRNAEHALGVAFPADYRECVRDNHGGAPEPDEFEVDWGHGRRGPLTIGLLLSLDPRADENVVATARDLSSRHLLPGNLVPIIHDGGDDFLCLDYGSNLAAGGPRVVWLDVRGGSTVEIAESFTGLLTRLAGAPSRGDDRRLGR